MSLQFYIGASGTGKSTQVYQDILERAEKEPSRRFFIIVPDQFTMQTQKTLCCLSEHGGIMNVEVLSFDRLSHRIFEELGLMNLPRLDDTGKNLILRKVAADSEPQLTLLSANIRRVGYIAEVKSMISELAQYGILPDELGRLSDLTEGRGRLSAKLKDIQILYQRYRDYIRDKYITTEESIDILVRNINRSELLSDSVVVFDGFTGFTPIQDKLLSELMLCTRQVIVTLLADKKEDLMPSDDFGSLFYLTAKTYQKLCRLAKENRINRDEDVILIKKPAVRFCGHTALAHLEQNLFRPGRIKRAECKGSVRLICCADPKKEADFICQTIRRMIRENGCCYRDFAVITGDLPTYGKILQECFDEHGIPLFLDQNTGLLFHPFFVFLLGLIHVVSADFSYESVMELLRTGYFDIEEETIDRFEQFIIKRGVRGKKKYQCRFSGTEQESELSAAEGVRIRLMEVLEPLLTTRRNARAYTEALYDICVILDIQKQLAAKADSFAAENMPAKAKEYEQVYAAVIGLFDQIHALLEEDMSIEEYGEILKAGFAELRVGSIPQSVDQVTAGDLERTRLKPVKVLFIAGVNDGIIPGHGTGGGYLSDLERSLLAELGTELAPTPRQKAFEERLYLYMNMTQPTQKLILSYAETDVQGGAIRPSYLVRAVKNLFSDAQTEYIKEQEAFSLLESRESGLLLLSRLMREYAAGILSTGSEEWEHFLALSKAFYGEKEFVTIVSSAFYEYQSIPLSQKTAEALYGSILRTSVSRLEQFAACAYAHFIKYGLRLKDEENYQFETVDLGNLYHDALYRFGMFLEKHGYTWFEYPESAAEAFVDETVDDFAKSCHYEVLYDTARNEAIKERTKQILKTSISSLSYQLKKGMFEPVCYELPFSYMDDPQLYGKIDRMDIAKRGQNVYVKVLDYKSGAHSFDPARLFFGLDLQLAVYLNAAVIREQMLYPDKEVIPSAVFYYQIMDPIVEEAAPESEEERNQRILKELRVQGLILEDDAVLESLDASKDTESSVIRIKYKKNNELTQASQTASRHQFDVIGAYADHKIRQIGNDIRSGRIDVSPAEDDAGQSVCRYCAYKSVCGFDEKLPGYRGKSTRLTKKEAYEAMEREVTDDEIHT